MFYARADYDNFLRNLKARRFKLSIGRNGITDFKEIGLIAVDSVAIDDLRSENVVQGGSVMGYEFRMVFTVPNMSVFADNQYVIDREDISKGRWYVSLLDIETNWVRVTPIPVAIDAIESDFNGTQYSFQLRTSDLEWIKHQSPTTPVVINPIILPNDNAVPATHTQSNPMTFAFRLSNPSLAQSIEDNVAYDILIYSDSARMNLVAQALNQTKAQIIDVAMSQLQVIDVVTALPYTFERGRIYYCIARCKYLNANTDTLFAFTTQLTAPTFVSPPTSITYPTNTNFQVTAQRNTPNANNDNANRVEFEWRIGTVFQTGVFAAYNNSGQATGTFQLSNISTTDPIFVKARSRNSVVIGEWSDEIQISVTLFRPSPIISNFSATTDKVALDAEPTENVFFSFQFTYSDSFGGSANWQVDRWDTANNASLGLIASGVQSTNPHIVLGVQLSPLPTVTTKEVITYRLRVFNPNGQSVHSDITITFIPCPPLTDVRWFLNPHQTVYQDVSNTTTPANAVNNPVGSWYSSKGDVNLYVLQNNASNRPMIKQPLSGRRTVFCQGGQGHFLIRPVQNSSPSQTVFNTASHREKFTVIMVSDFTTAAGTPVGNVCTFKRADVDDIVAFGIEGGSSNLDFLVGVTRTNERTLNVARGKFGVVCVTYDADSANRMKLYYNKLALPISPNEQSTSIGNVRAVADNGLGINSRIFTDDRGAATGTSSNSRHIGHIIIFTKVLTDAEIVAWSEWLQAIYKFSTA